MDRRKHMRLEEKKANAQAAGSILKRPPIQAKMYLSEESYLRPLVRYGYIVTIMKCAN